MLGRWKVKTCEDLTTSINSVYQNRDHCGDTICKTPRIRKVKLGCFGVSLVHSF